MVDDRSRSGYFSPGSPRAFAHRGLAVNAPENTLLAFGKAVQAGAIYIETDVRASRDGDAIIAHDMNLSRVAGRPERIDQLTTAELGSVDLGDGQSFCTLAQALAAFPDVRFNIDLKCHAVIAPAVAAIRNAGAIDRVLVTSFSERRRSRAVKQLPGVASSASAIRFVTALVFAKCGMSAAVRRVLGPVDAVQVPVKAAGMRTTTRRVLDAFARADVEVHFWTINESSEMTDLISRGAIGIISDRVDVVLDSVVSSDEN